MRAVAGVLAKGFIGNSTVMDINDGIIVGRSDGGNFCVEVPSSVVVLGKFRRFHLPIFSLFLPNLVFSYIYGIFSMPFGGFFY